ncbi:MAG: hypothetical protein ACW9W3_05880 [Candidatus Nitrosopumilus sp. bin_68KS]
MQTGYNDQITTMDSDVLISILKSPYVVKKILEIFRGNSKESTLQDIVKKEIAKMTISKKNRSIDDFV